MFITLQEFWLLLTYLIPQ